MFQEPFEKLELAEIATVLDRLNPQFDGVEFDPVDTKIMAVDMPFYDGYRFLDISNQSVSPALQRFVVCSDDNACVLDFSNEPIYKLNKDVPIDLNDVMLFDYLRFFFTYVKGRHGRFLITETVDDINWKEEPPPAARKAIGKMLKKLEIKNIDDHGVYKVEATIVFKDSLFKSDIYVSPDGGVTLKDEELLIEDMPVLDDVLGQ